MSLWNNSCLCQVMSRCDIDVNKYILVVLVASLHHKWLAFRWSQLLALYIGAYRTACLARYGKSQSQDKYLQTYYIVNQGPCNGADWMPADKLTETSWIKLKKLNSIARPYNQRVNSLLDFTACWLS